MGSDLNRQIGIDTYLLSTRPRPPAPEWGEVTPDDVAEFLSQNPGVTESDAIAELEGSRQHEDEYRTNFSSMMDDVVAGLDPDKDHVLATLSEARHQRDEAARTMRLITAYAREIMPLPRPTLESLARAAGLTVSGIRNTYDNDDVNDARHIISQFEYRALQRLPILVRAANMAGYISSLFLMTDTPITDDDYRLLKAVFADALIHHEPPWGAFSMEPSGSTQPWPLSYLSRKVNSRYCTSDLAVLITAFMRDVMTAFMKSEGTSEYLRNHHQECIDYIESVLGELRTDHLEYDSDEWKRRIDTRDTLFKNVRARVREILDDPAVETINRNLVILSDQKFFYPNEQGE